MSNKKSKKQLFIVFNIETTTDLISGPLSNLEKFQKLNKVLDDGNTTILLKEASKTNSNLIQFFGFQNSFRTEKLYETIIKDEEIIPDKNEYYFNIEGCKPVPENLNQEDIAEMYQEALPTKFDQISSAARCMVISNNKNTCKFTRSIELNYRYTPFFTTLNLLQEINYYQDKFFNLLVFDLHVEQNEQFEKEIKIIEEMFDGMDDSHYVSLLFSPFAMKYSLEEVQKSFKEQIQNNPMKDFINQIIPKQTYEFMYCEENKEFLERQKEMILMVQYSKDFCRKDKIQNFGMLNDLKNFNLIGNKMINFCLFWRELKFKMGKLPKFGA